MCVSATRESTDLVLPVNYSSCENTHCYCKQCHTIFNQLSCECLCCVFVMYAAVHRLFD